MIHSVPPWIVHTLKLFRVYVLESPWYSADVKSPSVSNLEVNIKSLPVLCKGAAYITHMYGSERILPSNEPKALWPGDYNVSISSSGKYCCIVSISDEQIDLKKGTITEPTVFLAGQTVLLLDGQVTINGYIYDKIAQIDLIEDKTFDTEYAVLAWTII